jgi:hypothetical protein
MVFLTPFYLAILVLLALSIWLARHLSSLVRKTGTDAVVVRKQISQVRKTVSLHTVKHLQTIHIVFSWERGIYCITTALFVYYLWQIGHLQPFVVGVAQFARYFASEVWDLILPSLRFGWLVLEFTGLVSSTELLQYALLVFCVVAGGAALSCAWSHGFKWKLPRGSLFYTARYVFYHFAFLNVVSLCLWVANLLSIEEQLAASGHKIYYLGAYPVILLWIVYPSVVFTLSFTDVLNNHWLMLWATKTEEFLVSLELMRGSSNFLAPSKASFLRCVLSPVDMPASHSHPIAASLRSAAADAMRDFITNAGFKPYVVSKSSRDVTERGERFWYMGRDVSQDLCWDEIRDDDVLMLVDVDYYVDINKYLAYGRPIVMYTFVPTEAGGAVPNGCYSIRDNVVSYRIRGNAHYSHQLWDYSGDFFGVPTSYGTVIHYAVEQLVIPDDPTRRLIYFEPIREVVNTDKLAYRGIVRKRLSFDGYNLVAHFDGDAPTFSFSDKPEAGDMGNYYSVTVPQILYNSLLRRWVTAKHRATCDVEKYLQKLDPAVAAIKAAILTKILDAGVVPLAEVSSGAGCIPIRHYQVPGPLLTEDGKEVGRVVSPPIISVAAAVPNRSYNNDVSCIQGRIEAVRNTKRVHYKYKKYAREFVDLVVEDPFVGVPISTEVVREHQNRPNQLAKSETCFWWGISWFIALCFQKAEAYTGINFPRNITTVPPMHTLCLSTYTYAFKEMVMKRFAWFMPGCVPTGIARRLQHLADVSEFLTDSDFSKFDGTISRWLRENVEFACYLRWCAPFYRSDLEKLLRAELNPKAVTQNGLKFDPGCSRLSGSPLTTEGNTLINAFVSYCAARESGLLPSAAFESLGAYYGDDGVSVVSATFLDTVASDLGLSVKVATKYRGDAVPFLGRLFVDPWTRPDSIQDPLRTLAKIHISFAEDTISDGAVAVSRARGYLATDDFTPIIGEYCRAVLRLSTTAECLEAEAKWSQLERDRPFFSRDDSNSWPQGPEGDERVLQVVADSLRWNASQVLWLCEQLDAARSFSDFPLGVIPNDTENKITAIVNGDEIVYGPLSHATGPTISTPLTSSFSESDSDASLTSSSRSSSPSRRHRRGKRCRSRPA